jgi:hypothetical protein
LKTAVQLSSSNGSLKTLAELDKAVAAYLRVCRDKGVAS